MGHIMTGVDRVCLHSDVEVAQSHKSSMAFALLFYVHGKHLRSWRDGQLT